MGITAARNVAVPIMSGYIRYTYELGGAHQDTLGLLACGGLQLLVDDLVGPGAAARWRIPKRRPRFLPNCARAISPLDVQNMHVTGYIHLCTTYNRWIKPLIVNAPFLVRFYLAVISA